LVFGSAAAGLPSLLNKPTQESFDGISFVGVILGINSVANIRFVYDISICKGFNSFLVGYSLAAVASAFLGHILSLYLDRYLQGLQ
jgi:hypothetical protein